ncbi:MAG: hypothetical protein R6V29_09360, partial [Spirochaetia bacterium]
IPPRRGDGAAVSAGTPFRGLAYRSLRRYAPGSGPGRRPGSERTDGADGTQNGETVFRLRLPRHHLVEEE